MPEVIVKYKDHKTLKMLKDIAKYFNFSVIATGKDKEPKRKKINGVTIIAGDKTIDTSELELIFSGKNFDPEQLRKEAWQRKN